MRIEITETNGKWQYVFYGRDGEKIEDGFRDSFYQCCSRCLELIVVEKEVILYATAKHDIGQIISEIKKGDQ